MSDEKKEQASASSEDKEKLMHKLAEEKKTLEEKNKRLASIIELTAKNFSKLKNEEAQKESGSSEDIVPLVTSIKKEIGTLERKIEKAKSAQSSEQMNAVLSEFKSQFEKTNEKLNILDKVTVIEKKLGEIEDSITLRRRKKENLFGELGTLGGGNAKIEDSEGNGDDENTEDFNVKEDFGKLDEINLKLDAIVKKMEVQPEIHEKHSFSNDIKKIIPFFGNGHKAENSEEEKSHKNSGNTKESKSKDISEIAIKKVQESQNINEDENYSSMKPPENKNILIDESIKFRIHSPVHYLDMKKIPHDIKKGHIVLLDVNAIKDQSVDELKHFIQSVKSIADSMRSKIMGVGEHHILVIPEKIESEKR